MAVVPIRQVAIREISFWTEIRAKFCISENWTGQMTFNEWCAREFEAAIWTFIKAKCSKKCYSIALNWRTTHIPDFYIFTLRFCLSLQLRPSKVKKGGDFGHHRRRDHDILLPRSRQGWACLTSAIAYDGSHPSSQQRKVLYIALHLFVRWHKAHI